jgi:hypothetical protein
MTAQSLLRIDITEIPAIEITCNKCSAMLSIPLPKQDVSESWNCLSCNTRLWHGEQDKVYLRLLGIMRSLSNWKEWQAPKNFSIGFSLTHPSKQASDL